MRTYPVLLLSLSLSAVMGCSYRPQVWTDEESGLSGFAQKMPAAESTQAVRDQTAGWIEGQFEDGLLLPRSGGFVRIHGFAGVYLINESRDPNTSQVMTSAIVFGENGTYIVQCVDTEEPPIAIIEKHTTFSGPPYVEAEAVIREIAASIRAGIPELRRIIEHDRNAK